LTWDTSCRDWEDRIIQRRSLVPLGPLFEDEGQAALRVFKSLKVVDVAGRPTFGECCDEWVFDFVLLIFGAYDKKAVRRLINEFFLLISKKNGKSTIAAGIMLTALIRNWRRSAELLLLAPTLEVAKNAWQPMVDMVRADAELVDLLHIQENLRQIRHRVTNALLKVLAADTDTVGGKKASFVLVDELWIFGNRANAHAMLMEATGGLASRPEGFVIFLSTQSDKPPAGIFKEKLDLYRNIRDGKIVDRKKFGILFEFPDYLLKKEAYLDPEYFYVTNPSLGRSVQVDFLIEKMADAKRGDKGVLNIFLAKHLNVQIGTNLRENRWPGAEYWAARELENLTFEELLARSEVAIVGIDGGGLDDLFGFCALGRCRETKRWLAWSHAWCHQGVLIRRQSIAQVLTDAKEAGELTIVDDELDDVSQIVAKIMEVKDRGILSKVAVDAAGLGELVDALAAEDVGITEENELLAAAPQGFGMMNAIKTAERKLTNGTLWHSPSKLMAWCVSNLKIEPTATAIRATKATAGDAKIDMAMALFDAVTFMSLNPEPPATSIYDDPSNWGQRNVATR